MSSSARPVSSKRRQLIEEQIRRKREKEFMHQQTWNGMTRYYQTFENANGKYVDWTSPRYYQNQQTAFEQTKRAKEKQESLEKRREKLKKLLDEEEVSFGIEATVKTRDKMRSPRLDQIPIELLKDVNIGLKLDEEEKRQKEAELALYNQWRRNNPTLREYERCMRSKELKLSWLDQQIEKRMQKEREMEECKKLLQERNRKLAALTQEEEHFKKQLQEKKDALRKDLEQQMEELTQKETLTNRLKAEEQEELKKKLKFEELQQLKKQQQERIKSREIALYNIKHHKLKLKEKAKHIEDNLKQEEELIKKLREAELADAIDNEKKRQEWKQTVEEFLRVIRDQRELEKQRQRYLDFVFESEAKAMFERQNEIWNSEKAAREQLLQDVLETLRQQIELKMKENRKKQLEILKEREEDLKRFEEYNKELRKMEEMELCKQGKWKKELEDQVKKRNELKKRLKTLEQKNLDLQLEKTKQEEERLKMEILKLQKQKSKFK